MTAPTLKSRLRQALRARRAMLTADAVLRDSGVIADRVMRLPEFAAAEGVLCYLALPQEVQTRALLEAAWRAGKRVAVPAARDDGEYMPVWLTPETSLAEGPLRVREPVAPVWAKPDRFDVAIIPGVGFSEQGARLGQGRGYYDRMLARLGPRLGVKVGVCFACQLEPGIPMDAHDVPMDWVVTEQALFRAR
jgi:5-formyltetrahydrofolate cyclo-ligase